jgi:predicted phosphodiesterase
VRILIVSDIHANWHALEAVLADAKGQYEQIVCCGDLVGYNPHPARVIEWVRAHCAMVIRGNHDKVVAGLLDLEWFNENAQAAALWTMHQLDARDLRYLIDLPEGPLANEFFEIVHGSPNDEDEYITNRLEAAVCFPSLNFALTFFGHTHVQGGFFQRRGNTGVLKAVGPKEQEAVLELEPDTQYMVNPGSVGQPRDGDPRAGYAIYNTEEKTVTWRRVRYPVFRTSNDLEDAGLPELLGERLFRGR